MELGELDWYVQGGICILVPDFDSCCLYGLEADWDIRDIVWRCLYPLLMERVRGNMGLLSSEKRKQQGPQI